MKRILLAATVLISSLAIASEPPPQPQSQIAAPKARHLVMFTRAGPNFSKIREHLAEARAHQAIYERLAADGTTIAGGAFEGEPVLGMTIWGEGIDEAGARLLIKDDQLPKLGIVTYEFRTLGVRMGELNR